MLDHAAVEPIPPLVPAGAADGSESAGDEQTTLAGHIERLLQAGRPAAARPLLLALKRRNANATRATELEVRLLLAEGQDLAALALLDAVLGESENKDTPTEALPSSEHAHFYLLRGQVHVARGDLSRAIADTAAAVMCDRSAPAPKLRLGVLLTQVGRLQDAIACLKEALTAQPVPDAFRGLASAYERAGQHNEAAALLADAIRAWPTDRDLRAAAVMRAIRARDYREAIGQAQAARRDGAINDEIFAMMGHAFAALGEHESAAAAYRDALKFAPDDPFLRQMAELSEAANQGDRVPPERVRALFDLMGPGFDQHIISLGYRVPGLIRKAWLALLESGAAQPGPALDLGCGTGLVALAISDCAGPMTGMDISATMLAGAQAKNLFVELLEGDLPALLANETRDWPLIVAGDVLTYFGGLRDILRGVAARLSAKGHFIFSAIALCPSADGTVPHNEGWLQVLGGRHVHSQAYVTQALQDAGFVVRSMELETLRYEARTPVAGWIIVAVHTTDSGVGVECGL